MKVTMVGTFPPIKGISEYCVQLAGALARSVEVDFVGFSHIYPERLYPGGTTEHDDTLGEKGVPDFIGVGPKGAAHKRVLTPFSPLTARTPLAWYNPFGWLLTGLTVPGDVLHVNWWTYFLAPVVLTLLSAAKLRPRPVMMTVHNVLGHESNPIDRLLTRLVFCFADHFIVHTRENRRQLIEVFGVPARRIAVVPYGPLDFYNDAHVSRGDARRRLDLADDERVLLHFGYIRDYKGLDVLLRALPQVADAVPNVKLVVAGTCWKGRSGWRKYQDIIDELDLAGRVKPDIGYVPSSMVKTYFSAADLVVLPYLHFEAQSGPGNIALAFGTPMVVTATGGLPDLVRDADAVVPPGDADALARAIVTCLGDDDKLARMSDDSAALAKVFSWSTIAERTVELYRELVH